MAEHWWYAYLEYLGRAVEEERRLRAKLERMEAAQAEYFYWLQLAGYSSLYER